MKTHTSFLPLLLFLLAMSSPHPLHSQPKPPYKAIALDLTQSCTTKEEKAKAIYQYVCQTIAYDVDHKIYTAAECYAKKKGTCQAYAMLYTELCKAVGVKCIYVSGVVKDKRMKMALTAFDSTHGYLLVEGDDKEHFFVDPTWGAGWVSNGVFQRSNNDMQWFKIDPEWMIFSHFPKDPQYQKLKRHVTLEEFLAFPDLRPQLKNYGFDGKEILNGFLQKTITSMPDASSHFEHSDVLTVVDVPLTRTLEVGDKYRFAIRKKRDLKYMLVHNDDIFTNWEDNGEVLSLSYVPDAPGVVYIAFQHLGDYGYTEVLSYVVKTPDDERWAMLLDEDPYYSPRIQALPGYHRKIKELGFDGVKLLDELENGRVSSLPQTFARKHDGVKIIDFPLNGKLKLGTAYRFVIEVPGHFEAALSHNKQLFDNWKAAGEKRWEITHTPDDSGTLTIHIIRKGGDRYNALLRYEIDEPSDEEWAVLIQDNPFYSKELRALEGYSADLQLLQFDAHAMLKAVNEKMIRAFPEAVYHSDYPLQVVDVPLDRYLMRDSTYSFKVVIPGKGKPILVMNDSFDVGEWHNKEGVWCLDYTPEVEGKLEVGVFEGEEGVYYKALTYEVRALKPFIAMVLEDCIIEWFNNSSIFCGGSKLKIVFGHFVA